MTISLDLLLPGDVILTAHNGFEWESLFIKIANFSYTGLENKDWTHSALYIGNGKIVEACTDGVKISDLKQKYLDNNYQILVLRHKNADEQSLKVAVEFCTAQAQKSDKYDWFGLTYFLLYNFIPMQVHFLLEDDFIGSWFHVANSYFCSELVSTGFLNANIYCFEDDPYKVMPVDFNNELLFQKIIILGNLPKQSKLYWASYLIGSIICFILTAVPMLIFGIIVFIEWVIKYFKDQKS